MGLAAKRAIERELSAARDKAAYLEGLRVWLHARSPQRGQPIDLVRWVPVEKIRANDYNPNAVAVNEMRLLAASILHDGYTQPVVAVHDPDEDVYTIVDGFHRFRLMSLDPEIRRRCNGLLPVVVLEGKTENERRASTIRHNRARGKHSMAGMADLVFQMLERGARDEDVCRDLGLEADELLRIKHVTGFSKLFEETAYGRAWEGEEQVRLRRQHGEDRPEAADGDQAVLEEPKAKRSRRGGGTKKH